nr:hypothetical protein [Paracoccus saliphilus]
MQDVLHEEGDVPNEGIQADEASFQTIWDCPTAKAASAATRTIHSLVLRVSAP